MVGQDAAVSGLLVALLCGGHVLMEGVPGVAKTLLVRTLGGALDVRTRRVQFTPDLMPGDITGSMVIDSTPGRADLPRGPDLHQPAAGRRDQPHAAQDPVGAARGDGGGHGLGGRRLARAAAAVPGGGHPEPRRVRRHLPAARGPARPVPAQGGAARARSAPTSWRSCGGTRPGSTRDGVADAGVRPVAGPDDIAAGQAAVKTGAGLARGRRLHRRHRPRHPRVAVAQPRRQPARRDRAAAGRPRLGLAQRPRLRHARRREGARRTRRSCTGSACAPRPSSRASTSRRCSPPRSAPSRSRADRSRLAMAISGRVPLLLLLGLVPVVLRPAMGTTWLWLLVVVVAVGLDWLVGPAPRGAAARAPAAVVGAARATRRRRRWSRRTPVAAYRARRRARRLAAVGRRDRQPAPGPARRR